jgi:hypothetical protein
MVCSQRLASACLRHAHDLSVCARAQNLTFGEDGGLTKACQAKHPAEPWLCFMSPRMQDGPGPPGAFTGPQRFL